MRGSSAGSLRERGAVGALLRIAVQPLRRDVGRVGLQHDRLRRQRGGQAADLQRALVRHRAAEAQLEAQRHEVAGLHLAAVEGMGDAAAHRHAPQAPEQGIGRAPHVQDDRQACLAGQCQLRQVEALLPRRVQPRHEVVQPDLAHRHQARIVAMRVQRRRADAAGPARPPGPRTADGCPAHTRRRRHAPARARRRSWPPARPAAPSAARRRRAHDRPRPRDRHRTRSRRGGNGCRSSASGAHDALRAMRRERCAGVLPAPRCASRGCTGDTT